MSDKENEATVSQIEEEEVCFRVLVIHTCIINTAAARFFQIEEEEKIQEGS